MAKAQKRNNRELKKPKQQPKTKAPATVSPFDAARAQTAPTPARKGG